MSRDRKTVPKPKNKKIIPKMNLIILIIILKLNKERKRGFANIKAIKLSEKSPKIILNGIKPCTIEAINIGIPVITNIIDFW